MANTKFVIIDKDRGHKRIAKAIKRLEGKDFHVLVGVFGRSGLALIASVHEFGSAVNNIPSRSFIRSTFDEDEAAIQEKFDKAFENILDNKINTRSFLALFGIWWRRRVVKKISSNIPPALKHREGTALINTGSLRNAIDSEVSK